MAKKRRPIGVEQTKNYTIVDYKNPPKRLVAGYRRKRVGNHLLTIAILKKKGPRGGRTVVTSVWHPKTESAKRRKK